VAVDHPYLTLARATSDHRAHLAPLPAGAALRASACALVHTHQTALAEAEVEYADHNSPSIYVRFPLLPNQPRGAALRQGGRCAGHLDTTPWTLAANLAVVANRSLPMPAFPVERAAGAST